MRQRRLGQNFLADLNLLDLIVREAEVSGDDVVLEVGGGGGALTERLAAEAACVHVVEVDERLRPDLESLRDGPGDVRLIWGDAMRIDLGAVSPSPTAVVSNLPYSIATPLIIRTVGALPEVRRWLVLVQLEIAERLAARPGSKAYGAPSAIVGLACDVRLVRRVPPEVFTPRPRVHSALLRLERRRESPSEEVRAVIRAAFAHRRKGLARSLELGTPGRRSLAVEALEKAGLSPSSRAEQLAPAELEAVATAVLAGEAAS